MPGPNNYLDITKRKRDLVLHKRLATGMLVVSAGIFITTLLIPDPGFWTHLVRTVSEAGLIGGLADWFAVTALFRQPLGIPIPHTGLIPNNKNRIGKNLGGFFTRHFLKEEIVVHKLRSTNLAGNMGKWLSETSNAEFLTDYALSAVPFLFESIDKRSFKRLMQSILSQQFNQLDLGKAFSALLSILQKDKHYAQILDQILKYLRNLLVRERREFDRLVGEQTRWWTPRAIDKEVARVVVDGIIQLIDELQDEQHEIRTKFDQATGKLITDLQQSDEYHQYQKIIKSVLLDSIKVQELINDIQENLTRTLKIHSENPSDQVREAVTRAFRQLARQLESDYQLQQHINKQLEKLIIQLLLPRRQEIGDFIAEVIRQWDAESLSQQIEIEVGTDLQYIRINGTLTGALVGCILFLLSHSFLTGF